MKRKDLEYFLNELLKPFEFNDYCPNGLQVEGREEIQKVAFAVSATRASAEQAVAWGADALIVHHGLFWRFHGVRPLTKSFAKRVFPLVRNDINLFGYHLPLDANMEVGNAKVLGEALGLQSLAPFGDHEGMPTGAWGSLKTPLWPKDLARQIESVLNHSVIHSEAYDRQLPIEKLGIITGGANSDWRQAARLGLDAYLTGEMSEHDWHESAEAGISMFAAGHHATERPGILALKKHLEVELGLTTVYFDSDNPA